ncbi:MAG: hypothetical protein Q8K30_04180 [Candidatus Gracilibacteria bacterium]|nr:hypothetical protein [Candidatus Gracilibacteria bacterium]
MNFSSGTYIESDIVHDQTMVNLLGDTFGFPQEIINQIFSIQLMNKIKGVDLTIGDILFRNKALIQKFKTKDKFLLFLKSKGFPLRLGEELLVSQKVSTELLDKSLNLFFEKKKINKGLLFGDILLDNQYISFDELLLFFEKNRVRLRVGEILLSKGLILQNELPELLDMQDIMRKKGNSIHLIDLLNTKKRGKSSFFKSNKGEYIEPEILKNILGIQKLSDSNVLEINNGICNFSEGIEVGEDTMDEDKFTRIFGTSKKINTIINTNNSDNDSNVDPWANEGYHSSLRNITK